VLDAARSDGYTELQARLIANRLSHDDIDRANGVRALIDASVSKMDGPAALPDIDVAVKRITEAIRRDEKLALLVDKDCDGSTGAAVLWHALVEGAGAKGRNVSIFASHRLKEGYGITDGLVSRLLEDPDRKPSLCISVDNGSTDEPRIAMLRANGVETIVSDHHALAPEGPPRSAVACINPLRTDSRFTDSTIAGCHVAFLLGAAVRRARISAGECSEHGLQIADLMQYTALGTIADSMGLRTVNNRALIRAGLRRINSPIARPCWNALRRLTGVQKITSQTLAWDSAPRVNAAGRIDWATPAIHWLMSIEDVDADHWMQQIDAANEERKKIQKSLSEVVDAYLEGDRTASEHAIVVDLGQEGHIGVNGILASRLASRFGVPAAVLSDKPGQRGTRVGSLRTPQGFHLREALNRIQLLDSGCLKKAGGHAAAAGIELEACAVSTFRKLFRQIAIEVRGENPDPPRMVSDGTLGVAPTISVLDEIDDIQPFGQGFPSPTFSDVFTATRARRIGGGGHLALDGVLLGHPIEAVWFNAPPAVETRLRHPTPVHYTLHRDTYRGEKIKAHISAADLT
jgi:single-stranded-DNA-specific exonuclease